MIFIGSIIIILVIAFVFWIGTSSLFGALGSFAIRKAKEFKQKASEEYSNE